MIRKQVYLGQEQNRKLKALAARRGCTEAEIIREALDNLPDPEGDLLERLAADGLLAPKPDFPHLPHGEAARRFLEDYEAWLDAHPRDLRLSEAVLEDRGPR
ncbi:MAG: CopG family transcriptional regulator [Chloroflexi bacterium]|nr:CopG family transcriptional regulator [Chloroflexota bacterium]